MLGFCGMREVLKRTSWDSTARHIQDLLRQLDLRATDRKTQETLSVATP